MTVRKIGKTVLKITLTDTEVINYFGAYEKLYTMSNSINIALNILLSDVIAAHKDFFENENIAGDIKTVKHRGCEITLYCKRPPRKASDNEYTFSFYDSESLTKAILVLFGKKQTRNLVSCLYKMPDFYCLIINSSDCDRLSVLNEFVGLKCNSPFFAEYVREYGRPLITKNAIKNYGIAFSKYEK